MPLLPIVAEIVDVMQARTDKHIATVSKSKMGSLITTLDETRMHKVNRAIGFALSLTLN